MNCGFFTVKRNTASEINKEMLNDILQSLMKAVELGLTRLTGKWRL